VALPFHSFVCVDSPELGLGCPVTEFTKVIVTPELVCPLEVASRIDETAVCSNCMVGNIDVVVFSKNVPLARMSGASPVLEIVDPLLYNCL